MAFVGGKWCTLLGGPVASLAVFTGFMLKLRLTGFELGAACAVLAFPIGIFVGGIADLTLELLLGISEYRLLADTEGDTRYRGRGPNDFGPGFRPDTDRYGPYGPVPIPSGPPPGYSERGPRRRGGRLAAAAVAEPEPDFSPTFVDLRQPPHRPLIEG